MNNLAPTLLPALALALGAPVHGGRADEITLTIPPVSAAGLAPDAVASDLMPFKIFNFSIHALAFSPDGRTLATGDGHGDLRLWDVVKGGLRATVNVHTGWLFSIAWLKDGRTVATGGKDRLVTFRELGPPVRLVKTFEGHASDVHAIALTADEKTLVSAGDDRTVRVWDVAGPKLLRTINAHERQIPTLALSPDGRLIASGSRDHTIRLWDWDTGRETAVLSGHKADVMSVKFSPDGRTLASGSYDQSVRLWDVTTLAPLNVLTGHTFRVYSVAFSPDGKRLASAGDSSARLWDTADGKPVRTFLLDGKIHTGQVQLPGSVSAVAYSPDGRHLAIATTLGTVLVVAPDTGTVLHTLTPPAPR